ncbi:MAG TPA: hypothetical protein VH143_20080 [Kofleriaceae bacterium]|nr:hypothetical protein [Kofleriaceae bacterium]
MRAIRDVRIRTLALVEALSEGEPDSWALALASIIARAHSVDDADAIEMLETFTHALADPALAYATRQRLYEAAVARNLPAIARLFLVASPKHQLSPALRKQLGPERALRPTDRPMTLGERKALARTHRREKLTLLVRDPHPQVVTIVLDNPHITEQDVVKMASARPGVPDSLALIASHPRWSVRHAVKRALVLNPSTPLGDAIRIATTLRSPELVELAGDASLPEPLRRHATEVLANLTSRPRA